MNEPTKEQIKEAMLKNRGGIENVSDEGLMQVWKMLPEEVRTEYLTSIKTETKNRKAEK